MPEENLSEYLAYDPFAEGSEASDADGHVLDNIVNENIETTLDFEAKIPREDFRPPAEAVDSPAAMMQDIPYSGAPEPEEDSFTALLRSPWVSPMAGVYDAVLNTGRFIGDGVDWLGQHSEVAKVADSFLDGLPNAPEWPATKGMIGKGGRAITSFIAAAYTPAKYLKAYNAIVRGGVSAGVAGATGFAHDAPNAANLIQMMASGSERMEAIFNSLPSEYQNILRALPNMNDKHPLFLRLQNGGVEAMFGVPFDMLLSAARIFKASRDAKKLAREDATVRADIAKARGDFPVQPIVKDDPDVIKMRALLDNLDRAEINGNPGQIKQAKQRLEKFKQTNPEGAKIIDDPSLSGNLGKGMLKSWGVPSLKPASFRDVGKGGIYKGSEQFVDPAILKKALKDKNFDLTKWILHPANNAYKAQLIENIGGMVDKIQKEVMKNVPGRPGQRKVAIEEFTEFEKSLASLGDGTDTYMTSSLLRSMEFGPKTVDDALVLEIIRSAQGMQSWHLMKRALSGDVSAARMLPKQLAIGAEVEAIARAAKSPLNKEMLKQIDQSVVLKYSQDPLVRARSKGLPEDVGGFGFGKSFNEEATNMMMRHAEMVPEFDGLDLAFRLNMLRTPQAYESMVRQMSRPGMFDAFLEAFYNSILSRPITIIGNFVSSHLFAVYQIPVRAIAGMVGVVDRAIVGRSGNDVAVGEFLAGTYGYIRGGVNQFFPFMKNLGLVATFRKPISESGLQKFEAYSREAWNAEGFKPAISALDKIVDNATRGALSVKTPAEFLANATGRILRTTQSLFATGDELNRAIAFDMGRHMEAYRYAANSGKSPLGMMKEMHRHIKDIPRVKGNESYDMSNMIAFVDEVESGATGSAGFRDWVDNYPVLRVAFPFVRSQASIFSAFVNNSPLAVASPRFRKALKAGGAERQLALSRLMLGSAMSYAMYEAWASGRLTGSGTGNRSQLSALKKMGWQPTSVLVDGDSFFATMFDFERSMEATLDRVIDGDTIDVRDADGEVHRIRLKGLDAAELGTLEGFEATDVLRSVLADNPVLTIKWSKMAAKKSGKNWGDRLLGTVYLDGKDIGETMIDKGAGQFRPEPPKYVSLRAFEPFATHLDAIVNTLDTINRIDDSKDRDNLFMALTENVAGNLMSKQYTKGFATLVDILQSKGGDRLLKSFVPAILSDVSRHLDPTHRDYRTIDPTLTPEHKAMTSLTNTIMSKTPLKSALIPDYDGMGHLGVRPPSWGSSFFNFMPTKAKVYNKVWQQFAVNHYFPKKLDPVVHGADLLPHEYADLQKFLGTLTMEGKDIYAMMGAQVDAFGKDDQKGPDSYRSHKLDGIRKAYKAAAERMLLKKYPEIIERIEAVEIDKNISAYNDQPFEQEKSMMDFLQRGPN